MRLSIRPKRAMADPNRAYFLGARRARVTRMVCSSIPHGGVLDSNPLPYSGRRDHVEDLALEQLDGLLLVWPPGGTAKLSGLGIAIVPELGVPSSCALPGIRVQESTSGTRVNCHLVAQGRVIRPRRPREI
jgi:hypothetical protein